MAITFVGFEDVGGSGVSDDSTTANVHASVQDDDVGIAFYTWNDNEGLPLTLSGWTEIEARAETTGSQNTTALYYRVASSEPASYTISGSDPTTGAVTFTIAWWRGVDTSSPFRVAFAAADHYTWQLDGGATPQPDSIGSLEVNDRAIVFCWTALDGTSAVSGPTGYTDRVAVSEGNARNICVADKVITSSGTESPGTFNHTGSASTDDSAMYTVALRHAAAKITNLNLESLLGVDRASLTNIRWSWFDQPDPKDQVAPTDQGTAESTDGSGNISIDLPNSTLTSGQIGWLDLRHAGSNLITGFRVAVD